MTTATQESLERVAVAAWAYREGRETPILNAGQTSKNFQGPNPRARCSYAGCKAYAAPGHDACGNHWKQPCVDCGAPVSRTSARCVHCGPKYASEQRKKA